MCWQSLSGMWALCSIPTVRSQGALGPACTSSTVPWQFLLPLEQIGASGFVGTPPCLAAASKQPPPFPLGSPAPAGRGAVYFTHGHPTPAHRYPAHTAAHPGLRHTVHSQDSAPFTHACPPASSPGLEGNFMLMECCFLSYARMQAPMQLPSDARNSNGSAHRYQQHYRHTANCSPLPLSAPNLPHPLAAAAWPFAPAPTDTVQRCHKFPPRIANSPAGFQHLSALTDSTPHRALGDVGANLRACYRQFLSFSLCLCFISRW